MKFDIKLQTIEQVKNFCDYANNVSSEIYAEQGRYVINAKSILGIFSLDLTSNISLTVHEPNDEFYDFFEEIKKMDVVCKD